MTTKTLVLFATIVFSAGFAQSQEAPRIATEAWKPSTSLQRTFDKSLVDFRGGLVLWHGNRKLSGGFSAIAVSRDGAQITALSDYSTDAHPKGKRPDEAVRLSGWARLDVKYDAVGNLCNVALAEHGQLRSPQNTIIPFGVESIARVGERFLVSFDGSSRVHSYPLTLEGPATVHSPQLANFIPAEDGIEASAATNDGLFLIAEKQEWRDSKKTPYPSTRQAWLIPHQDIANPISLKYDMGNGEEILDPKGATFTGRETLVVVEQKWLEEPDSTAMRIVEIPTDQLQLGTLKYTQKICRRQLFSATSPEFDNFEGISSFRSKDRDFVLLVTDNNGDWKLKNGVPKQRTLLILLELLR